MIKKLLLSTMLLLGALFFAPNLQAQQEGFIGEVKMFAGNFAPRGWALCEGQLLPISQHQALFSILGTTYGGDGRTTFALPDMRGRAAVGNGNGPGLTDRRLGTKLGTETVTLNQTNLPAHNHSTQVPAFAVQPKDSESFQEGNKAFISVGNAPDTNIAAPSTNSGGSQPVNNMAPSLIINYIICMQGVFPSRS